MRKQTTATTLKAFVRVSKNSDAPNPKAAAKPAVARPMTRSRSTSSAIRVEPEKEAVVVTRKRKLAEDPKPVKKKAKVAPAVVVEEQPAPVAVVELPPMVTPAKPKGKKATTISAYFSPTAKKDSAPAATAEPVILPEVAEVPMVPVSAARAQLKGTAAELLTRLRNRHKATATSAEETRSIQDDLRTRRIPIPAASTTAIGTKATFAESGTLSSETQQQRALHRQFVAITTPGSKVVLSQHQRKLYELFQALDHTVMFGGQRSVIYHRIRSGVESMAKRTFGWRELGQILAIYPESYTHQAVPTVHDGRRVVSVELAPQAQGVDLARDMEARRIEFVQRLSKSVLAAHRAFLVDRRYSDQEIEALGGALHPAFDIESTPQVTPLTMPPTPADAAGPVAAFDRT
ncbi:hypothetical protein GGI21_005526, partial [Coemansia aciculifera]